MTKSAATIEQLMSRLHEHALELAAVRATIAVQFKRIAEMQAELDVLPHARKRRKTLRALLAEPPSHNGRNHSHD